MQSQSASFLEDVRVAGNIARPEPAGEPEGSPPAEKPGVRIRVQQLMERLESTWANNLTAKLEHLVSSMSSRESKCDAMRGQHIGM